MAYGALEGVVGGSSGLGVLAVPVADATTSSMGIIEQTQCMTDVENKLGPGKEIALDGDKPRYRPSRVICREVLEVNEAFETIVSKSKRREWVDRWDRRAAEEQTRYYGGPGWTQTAMEENRHKLKRIYSSVMAKRIEAAETASQEYSEYTNNMATKMSEAHRARCDIALRARVALEQRVDSVDVEWTGAEMTRYEDEWFPVTEVQKGGFQATGVHTTSASGSSQPVPAWITCLLCEDLEPKLDTEEGQQNVDKEAEEGLQEDFAKEAQQNFDRESGQDLQEDFTNEAQLNLDKEAGEGLQEDFTEEAQQNFDKEAEEGLQEASHKRAKFWTGAGDDGGMAASGPAGKAHSMELRLKDYESVYLAAGKAMRMGRELPQKVLSDYGGYGGQEKKKRRRGYN